MPNSAIDEQIISIIVKTEQVRKADQADLEPETKINLCI